MAWAFGIILFHPALLGVVVECFAWSSCVAFAGGRVGADNSVERAEQVSQYCTAVLRYTVTAVVGGLGGSSTIFGADNVVVSHRNIEERTNTWFAFPRPPSLPTHHEDLALLTPTFARKSCCRLVVSVLLLCLLPASSWGHRLSTRLLFGWQ